MHGTTLKIISSNISFSPVTIFLFGVIAAGCVYG